MCLSFHTQRKYQTNPMLHYHHTRNHVIKKRVSFNTKHSVHLHFGISEDGPTYGLSKARAKAKDPISKERRMQQLISRRAVLSFQRHLHRNVSIEKDDCIKLASVSRKFSQRAREVARETARLNYLEAYEESTDDRRPRFSYEISLEPVIISNFPLVKLTRSPVLTRRKSSGELYER